jgi:glycosyltransferase involved in cell wall biosynthesis
MGAAGQPDLTILMPVYNEVGTVTSAIDAVLGADLAVSGLELIVIDDGSDDGTSDLLRARDPNGHVRVVHRPGNGGKGAAIRTGLTHASGRFTAIFDADLEYEPSDLNKLLAPLLAGDAEVVFGARGFSSHTSYSFWYVMGNKFVTMATNILYNSWISDVMTCHKLLPTELFRSLDLHEAGFAIEAEIAARLLRGGVRIYEVPVSYRAREREEGKKLTAVDGLRVLRTLLRCRIA